PVQMCAMQVHLANMRGSDRPVCWLAYVVAHHRSQQATIGLVATACASQQPLAIQYMDVTPSVGDHTITLKPVGGQCDAHAPHTEHLRQELMRHVEVPALQAVQ